MTVNRDMTTKEHLICLIVGHRAYDPEVLATRPWEDPDFYQYSQDDFREPKCLRCGEPLGQVAA